MRDMTKVEYIAALLRNGFQRPVLFWITSADDRSVSYGVVVDRKTGRVMRRATIAHIIKARAAHQKKKAKELAG